MARRSEPYSRYAAVYDLIGQRRFGEGIAEATLGWLDQHERHVGRVADLACGTGAAALVFAAAGMTVTGVDRSAEMLVGAERAAETAGLSVSWLQQDLRDLDLPQPVDLATCFYDSVNYLVEDGDLECFFARVNASLVAGGLFVFDLNTRRRLAEGWSDACVVATDGDDLFGVYRSWFDPATSLSPLVMTFFVRSQDEGAPASWERFDEEHLERAYPLDQVTQWLSAAGFRILELHQYNDGAAMLAGAGSEESARVVFIVRRDCDELPASSIAAP